MRSLVLTLGHKPATWIDEACKQYSSRLPKDWEIQWRELRAEPRSASNPASQCILREAQRIEASLQPGSFLMVALDERGSRLNSLEFAAQCGKWHEQGEQPAFVIGGADGLHPSIRDRAKLVLQLSSFTLPHGLVRVVIAEQLFRAWSILQQHPYHRA
jgi:23S rRNA (pseudouridine1915-N3)-methyltransferase